MSGSITITTTFPQHLQQYLHAAPMAIAGAFTEVAWVVLGHATDITPLRFGALRGSAHVKQPVMDGRGVFVEFGFGGAAAPYAWYVHENLPPSVSAKRYSTPGTGPKYLETAVKADQAYIRSATGAAAATRLRGIFG